MINKSELLKNLHDPKTREPSSYGSFSNCLMEPDGIQCADSNQCHLGCSKYEQYLKVGLPDPLKNRCPHCYKIISSVRMTWGKKEGKSGFIYSCPYCHNHLTKEIIDVMGGLL